ncbi:uncharacterized protein EV420DRAFT_745843 [Desarmillaria tabescens]|uniref:Protein kinase domain-containing protein n=1 Tax=Armillaria tabescens TaxID=1929756 RepID=A0AA39JYT3_ARMTA|nr:uncharacterized protein EV420DRAFT_745843 [Desarmillaria tabescens]KAK0450281.1 hypothetical protein EV420DRAFT_745843 [Desarmillaria tabescens]
MSTSAGVPSLESTYFAGASLQLYSHPPPDCPADEWCSYGKDALVMTRIEDRLNASIARRVPIPSIPTHVSIILNKRLVSSTRRIPHVWTAHIQDSSSDVRYPLTMVAKIYDPVYFDSEEAEYIDPFALHDLTVSRETEAYRRLEYLQGAKVPRCYGHFVAPLTAQCDRSVNVVLLEYIHGRNILDLVPRELVETLCSTHKDALIDAALRLYFEIYACGVVQADMQPRNVMLRCAKHENAPFCSTEGCPLFSEMDCEDIQMVMVDFEDVEFREPDSDFSDPITQENHVEKVKPIYLEKWLMNEMA